MEITPELEIKLKALNAKYEAMGQDLSAYLDGLLYTEVTSYWDYIQLDVLLSLQKPKTKFADEVVFIAYHQITELYFNLAIREMENMSNSSDLTKAEFLDCLGRVNRYFEALISSFSIMVQGMDPKEFLKFRMALLPASGFQSAQYRIIELQSTDFINLVDKSQRHRFTPESEIKDMFDSIYWKWGATDVETGKKTLTLTQFEDKYEPSLIETAESFRHRNVWKKCVSLSLESDPEVIAALKTFDLNVNVYWPLAHYKSAVRYMASKEGDVPATGGTNWQTYLPPKFQKRIFFPAIWSESEKEEWGKGWVEERIKEIIRGA